MSDTSKFSGGIEGGRGGYDPDLTLEGIIRKAGVTPKYEWPNPYYTCPECDERHEPGTSHIYRK